MLFYEQPTEPWNQFDFMLLEAYENLKNEICQECGNPIWICRNEEAHNIGFKVRTVTCFAKAEMDKWQKQREKQNKELKPGELPFVTPYSYDDSPMPTRMQFFRTLSDKIE